LAKSDGRGTQGGGADLVVISGPSGVGKSTVTHELLRRMDCLAFSVSATTRPPRSGERDGLDYHFVSRREFERRVREGGFIEHAEVFGQLYGTPVEELAKARRAGRMLLLEIDVQGGIQIFRQFPQALFVLLTPPSGETLHERLSHRATETSQAREQRFAAAEDELRMARASGAYTAEVINDTLEEAVRRIEELIRKHRRMQDDRSTQE
jgi:guanylate kinase